MHHNSYRVVLRISTLWRKNFVLVTSACAKRTGEAARVEHKQSELWARFIVWGRRASQNDMRAATRPLSTCRTPWVIGQKTKVPGGTILLWKTYHIIHAWIHCFQQPLFQSSLKHHSKNNQYVPQITARHHCSLQHQLPAPASCCQHCNRTRNHNIEIQITMR